MQERRAICLSFLLVSISCNKARGSECAPEERDDQGRCPVKVAVEGGGAPSPSDWSSPSLGTMKWIPAGTFIMGSPTSESGRDSDETQHRVTLTRGFLLMEHEVTQGEWQAVMGSNPSESGRLYWDGQDKGPCLDQGRGSSNPVYCVSWDDIQAFIQKVSARDGVQYRLPSEAQWEYAARGGQNYVYAGSNELGSVGWYDGNSGNTTHAVCQKQRNGYGLCDMSGNVLEWVEDLYGAYPGDTTDYVNTSSGSYRVFRGGSWSRAPEYVRVASRDYSPSYRSLAIGFRLARTIP